MTEKKILKVGSTEFTISSSKSHYHTSLENYWKQMKEQWTKLDVPSQSTTFLSNLDTICKSIVIPAEDEEALDRKQYVANIIQTVFRESKVTVKEEKRSLLIWHELGDITNIQYDMLRLVTESTKTYTLKLLKKILEVKAIDIRNIRLEVIKIKVQKFVESWLETVQKNINPQLHLLLKTTLGVLKETSTDYEDFLKNMERLSREAPLRGGFMTKVNVMNDFIIKWGDIERDCQDNITKEDPTGVLNNLLANTSKELNSYILTPDTWKEKMAEKLKKTTEEVFDYFVSRFKIELNVWSSKSPTHYVDIKKQLDDMWKKLDQNPPLAKDKDTGEHQPTVKEVIDKLVDIDKRLINPTDVDTGYLNDDNAEFILNNHSELEEALAKANETGQKWQLNNNVTWINNCFWGFKNSKEIEWGKHDFTRHLETSLCLFNIFPIRIQKKQWALFIAERVGGGAGLDTTFQIWYYSPSTSNFMELKKLQPFLDQVVDSEVSKNAKIIPNSNKVYQTADYDSSIFLIFTILKMLKNRSMIKDIKEPTEKLTKVQIHEFRKLWRDKWISKFGQETWCSEEEKEKGVKL